MTSLTVDQLNAEIELENENNDEILRLTGLRELELENDEGIAFTARNRENELIIDNTATQTEINRLNGLTASGYADLPDLRTLVATQNTGIDTIRDELLNISDSLFAANEINAELLERKALTNIVSTNDLPICNVFYHSEYLSVSQFDTVSTVLFDLENDLADALSNTIFIFHVRDLPTLPNLNIQSTKNATSYVINFDTNKYIAVLTMKANQMVYYGSGNVIVAPDNLQHSILYVRYTEGIPLVRLSIRNDVPQNELLSNLEIRFYPNFDVTLGMETNGIEFAVGSDIKLISQLENFPYGRLNAPTSLYGTLFQFTFDYITNRPFI